MLYHGSHLEAVPVTGVNQVHLRHPSLNYCDERQFSYCHPDFSRKDSLPYCDVSKQKYNYVKKTCYQYLQHIAEVPDGDGVSLSTRGRKFNMTKTCIPNPALNISCHGPDEYAFELLHDFYTIDAERFWLWIEHSMTSGREGLSSKNSLMKGYYWSCDPRPCHNEEMLPLPDDFATPPDSAKQLRPLPTAVLSANVKIGEHNKNTSLLQSGALAVSATSSRLGREALARESHKLLAKTQMRSQRIAKRHAASSAGTLKSVADNTRSEPFVLSRPGIWWQEELEAIPMQYLLDIVNVSLDDPFKGVTYRDRGIVITISLRYLNTKVDTFDFVGLRIFPWTKPLFTKLPWDPEGYTRARYELSARAHEQGYVVDRHEGEARDNHYIQRRFNGIYIKVAQSGEMLVWSWSLLAIHVSTAMGLLSVAYNLTNFWAWACRSNALQNLLTERYVISADSGRYEQVDKYDDLT
eukprot:TRINITY_DN3932_c0_g4_i1.p1 TRINITY_DN3932_c0_g4~~TRINITY_DN3932_c0_g4_i1.p1  ORF type:complete len:515 (-),score=17.36 TRINITY_DN3932_c0_g4_i1:353-1750(-)